MSIRHIGVVGDPLDIHLLLVMLVGQTLPYGINFSLLASQMSEDSNDLIEFGEEFLDICQLLKVNPIQLAQSAQGTFTYGVNCDWLAGTGFIGAAQWGLNANQSEFEHGVFNSLKIDPTTSVSDFSIAGKANQLKRFAIPAKEQAQWQQGMLFGVVFKRANLLTSLKKIMQSLPQNQVRIFDEVSDLDEIQNKHKDVDFWIHVNEIAASSKTSHQQSNLDFDSIDNRLSRQDAAITKYIHNGYAYQKVAFADVKQASPKARLDDKHLTIYLPTLAPVITNIHFLFWVAEQLLKHWPAVMPSDSIADSFNHGVKVFSEEIYKFNQVLFNGIEGINVAELFAECGRLPPMATDAVSKWQWYCLLCGNAVKPKHISVALSNTSTTELHNIVQQVAKHIEKVASQMPNYNAFYQEFSRPNMSSRS
ncbi:hypothetical protein [Glaciecola sp. 1036]|uniref:hypothetical protein n=1 Tax=Alteromonadaceae TaxID=72275 RepID=UPI003CFDFC44